MSHSIRRLRRLAALACAAGAVLAAATQAKPAEAQQAGAQAAGPTASMVRGVVTLTTISGDTVGASDVMVTLWTTDAATEAIRDSACTAWLTDKNTWLQARQELATPSGIDWTGTKMATDLNILKSLMLLRRDTTRTNATGEFTFQNVPIGAYTVEGETFASNKFLQWSRDLAAMPYLVVNVRLDPGTLAENQFCSTSPSANGTAGSGSSPNNRSPPPSGLPGPQK